VGAGHGDRLTSLDASFLHMETANVHMHVGGLFLFDARDVPDLDFGQFLRLVRSRLHLVPRYRHKLASAPFNLHNPIWIDDPSFDLSFHVRHAALPVPGTMAQLMEYSARILSRPLDRNRPLWELYVIEGIEGDRFAILGKNHHAMIDGVAGIDIATVMLDVSPDTPDDVPAPEPWSPAPSPAGVGLALDAVRDLVTAPKGIVDAGRRLAAAPGAAAAKALRVGRGVVGVVSSNLPRPAPRSPLNHAPGRHRRFAVQRVALERVKAVKDTYSTTVNDVVLAITADATGRFLRSRGTDTDGLWLKAMVPVSVRVDDQRAELGNKVASVFVSLPMFEMDAVERLEVCREAMSEVKQSQHAVGAEFLIGLTQFAPPTIHAAASRLAARARLFNFLVTNIPGPQIPIYCLGARLIGAFPFTPLAPNHTYAVGIVSIDGWLNFGFTADWDTLPDIENVTGFLIDAMQELERSAEAADTHSELARKRGPAEPPTELRKA
jgi:WS/DGAT/MGAT family acyltransferase